MRAAFPARHHFINFVPHRLPCGGAVAVFHKQFVIPRMRVPDVRDDRQPQRLRIKFLCRRRTPDAAGMFPARPGGGLRGLAGASGTRLFVTNAARGQKNFNESI